jgi:hypothetical protein
VAVALAECCIAGGIGARVELALDLFGESPGAAYVVSGPREVVEAIGTVIGTVGGSRLVIEGRLDVAVSELAAVHERGLAEFV